MLLLCLLEDADHVRWNLMGLLGNMACVAGLHRDPRDFKNLKKRNAIWGGYFSKYANLGVCGLTLPTRSDWYIDTSKLLTSEAVRYGYPANLREDAYDCKPLDTPASSAADPDNTFLYWMFILHKTISTSFPGPIGIQKSFPLWKEMTNGFES
jgi:hypothetical protein